MTRVIVNDASCLIDLRKGGLLPALCNLPYQPMVPLPVRVSEVLDFADAEWRRLDSHGMITHDLTPHEVMQAFALKSHHRSLSANDCICLVTALTHRGTLLTSDALLRKVGTTQGLRVHGVLWVIDELAAAGACDTSLLIDALQAWDADRAVFLPRKEINRRLVALAKRH